MKRHRAFWGVLVALFAVLMASNAMAGWKEDQAAMFEQIPVKPGDKIDTSNWEKVKDLLPPSVVNYVKKGDFTIEIAELNWAYQADDEWLKKTAENAGKYDVSADGSLIDKSTGKLVDYVYGEPFPEIDLKDRKAGAKLAHNMVIKSGRAGEQYSEWSTIWVGRGGFERIAEGSWTTYNYWARPNGKISNPSGLLLTSLIKVETPYDVAGICSINQRSIDQTPDQGYSYVPAIRRVKKVSGTTRSSPFLGTDFCNDDSYNWYGKNETMEWKLIGKKIVLMPIHKYNLDGPVQFEKKPNGTWAAPASIKNTRSGYEVSGWKGAPWAPVDLVYVPRMMYIVEAVPKDPYYNFGKMTYYIEPFHGFIYKLVNDRSGGYWKTLLANFTTAKWDGRITTANVDWQLSIDDKADHATITNDIGKWGNKLYRVEYGNPDITPALFSPTNLAAQSK